MITHLSKPPGTPEQSKRLTKPLLQFHMMKKILLLFSLLCCLLAGTAWASGPTTTTTAVTAEFLRADGTLNMPAMAGQNLSLDLKGWNVSLNPTLGPVFAPAPTSALGFSALDKGLNGNVNAIAVSSTGDVYVGGDFTGVAPGGTAVEGLNRIAKWNGTAWSALDKGLNGTVYAIAVSGSTVYVGGLFGGVGTGGTAVEGLNSIAKWNGTAWSALDKGLNNDVNAIAASGSDVYVGGSFTNVGSGGTAVTGLNRIARWGEVAATPTITVTGTLTAFSACAGSTSAQQSFTVSGSNLTAAITVTAPDGFEVSDGESSFGSSVTLTQISGSVATTPIYVRMKNTATGTPSGDVTVASTDATTKTVAVSGRVNALPLASIGKSSAVVCAGSPISFTANPPGNAAGLGNPSSVALPETYSWASLGGSFTSTTNSPTQWSHTTPGSYTISLTVSKGSCTNTATTTVSVNALPSVIINPTTSSICVGATLNLSASAPASPSAGLAPTVSVGDTYTWVHSGGGAFSSSAASATFSSSSTGGFRFTVTASNSNNCSATATASVTVGNPNINAIAPSSICAGATITLTASGGISYSWVHSGGGSFSSSGATATFSSSSAGGYSFTVTGTISGGCTATATTSVSVKTTPSVSITPASLGVCVGKSLNLSALVPPSTLAGLVPNTGPVGDNYAWASSGGSFVSNTGSPVSWRSSNAGTFGFTVTASNSNSCSATATASVSVQNPDANFTTSTGKSYLCPGSTLTLIAPAQQGQVSYEWLLNNRPLIPTANSNTLTVSLAGPYTLKVTDATFCKTTDSKQIYITAAVATNYTATHTLTANKLTLVANPTGMQYTWSGPLAFSSTLRSPVINSPNNSRSGVYTVGMLTPSTGCTGTATTSVKITTGSRLASEENETEIGMEVQTYPNPTSKLLTVEVTLKEPSALKLQLYNATGNALKEWNLSEETTIHRKEIDMSVYKDGLYLLQAQSKDGKQTKRVMKVE